MVASHVWGPAEANYGAVKMLWRVHSDVGSRKYPIQKVENETLVRYKLEVGNEKTQIRK